MPSWICDAAALQGRRRLLAGDPNSRCPWVRGVSEALLTIVPPASTADLAA
jgi:hypothetical protein